MSTRVQSPPVPVAPAAVEAERRWRIEEHHVNYVPEEERTGRARSLFFVWFAANLSISTVIVGALPPILGNTLLWSLAAILLGNGVGAIFMALHSAQGPVLGVPQLIQGRGQFGFHGALFPVVLAFLQYVGFFAFGAIAAAQCLQSIWPGLSSNVALAIISVPSLLMAIVGYHVIHLVQKVTTVASIVGIVILTGAIIRHGGTHLSASGFHPGPFLLALALVAVYQIGFAPYVSDYSRYLPGTTRVSSSFWWTYGGTVVSAVWVMAIGAFVATQFTKLGPVDAVSAVTPGGMKGLILLTLAFSICGINAMNLYGGQLSLATLISSIRPLDKGVALRLAGIAVTFALAMYLAVAATANFLANFQNFLLLLVYAFGPWTAINLVDFYVVRRGRYDIKAFFDPRGIYASDPDHGVRHGVNIIAMSTYAVGILVQIPFVNTSWYKGWFVDSLQGADIAWIVGITVSAALFWALSRGRRVPETAAIV